MRLIIDTDTAGDDAFSILLALRRPDVTLEAVTIAHGNVAFDHHVRNALITLEAAGRHESVPVYLGRRAPLARAAFHAAEVFGEDGMGGAILREPRQKPEEKDAVDAIVDSVMQNPGEITILAQAPLTNIAVAVQKEPRIAKATRHLWIMGGAEEGDGNVTPAAEFNFYADPEAAKIVFGAGFAITLSTWTLTMRSGVLPEEHLAEIERMHTPLADFFRKANRAALDFMREHHRAALSTHPNSLACACMLDESLILEAEDCLVDVEIVDGPNLALSRISPTGPGQRSNARVIRRADTEKFGRMLIAALA